MAGTADSEAGAPLDDVMLAMDVVDQLRYRERLVQRELDSEARERQLLERLREIYAGQGIEVPDEVLRRGVEALAEDRFGYSPPAASLQVRLARLYVSRGTWGRWSVIAGGLAVAVWAGYAFFGAGPRERQAEQARIELAETLPGRVTALRKAILAEAKVEPARRRQQPDIDAVFLGQQAEFIRLLDLHVPHPRRQKPHESQLRSA